MQYHKTMRELIDVAYGGTEFEYIGDAVKERFSSHLDDVLKNITVFDNVDDYEIKEVPFNGGVTKLMARDTINCYFENKDGGCSISVGSPYMFITLDHNNGDRFNLPKECERKVKEWLNIK